MKEQIKCYCGHTITCDCIQKEEPKKKHIVMLVGDGVPKQETLEEAAERLQKDKYGIFISKDADVKGQLVIDTAKASFLSGINEGAEWQAKRMYSEEDMTNYALYILHNNVITPKEWFNKVKKK